MPGTVHPQEPDTQLLFVHRSFCQEGTDKQRLAASDMHGDADLCALARMAVAPDHFELAHHVKTEVRTMERCTWLMQAKQIVLLTECVVLYRQQGSPIDTFPRVLTHSEEHHISPCLEKYSCNPDAPLTQIVRRPDRLRERQQPLQALNVFPRNFVV